MVGVDVGVMVGISVGEAVGVAVAVGVLVAVGVAVGVVVGVAVSVGVAVVVGVGVLLSKTTNFPGSNIILYPSATRPVIVISALSIATFETIIASFPLTKNVGVPFIMSTVSSPSSPLI